MRVWEWADRSVAPHGGPGRARPGSWGTERSRYTQSWRLPALGRSPVWPPGRPAPAPHKTLINYRYLNQCCWSGMFIPDPGCWFLPIPDPRSKNGNEREGPKICCHTGIFSCSPKFQKLEEKNFLCWRKNLGHFLKHYRTFYPKICH